LALVIEWSADLAATSDSAAQELEARLDSWASTIRGSVPDPAAQLGCSAVVLGAVPVFAPEPHSFRRTMRLREPQF
jgi:hypothetical protein